MMLPPTTHTTARTPPSDAPPPLPQTGEERHLSLMQYVSWPDHGVPEQAADFVQFVQRVRAARAGLVEPTVVHCSAGIGRTGVLILMETAMCLIEANQPVYPLELVRAMRRQRAMMIQPPVSGPRGAGGGAVRGGRSVLLDRKGCLFEILCV